MPTILTEDLVAEWISDNLSEQRITKLATFLFPATEMNAYIYKKISEQRWTCREI